MTCYAREKVHLFKMKMWSLPSVAVLSFSSMATSHVVATHPETMKVGLEADVIGFGLSLQGGATERGVLPLVISAIVEGGPAARLGQLQVGTACRGGILCII